ncbi:MAG: ABC transporter substrate-binding protein [Clostridiales bacterium]|jgi:NitT/TauT family transport system substrate-binding protein|nr:ABC transporter substrate-binding protein [Clostridiales bacterium]
MTTKVNRRYIAIVIVFALLVPLIALVAIACNNNSNDSGTINIVAMRGPTGMGFGQFNERIKQGQLEGYKLDIVGTPDNVTSELVSGRADIASLPSNMAPLLVNNGKVDLKILSINVGNVIHLISRTKEVPNHPLPEDITSLADLKGKKVSIHGVGSTPEAVLKHLLSKQGLQDNEVELDDQGTPEAITAGLSSGNIDYAILPQPAVSANLIQGNAKSVLDLGDVWRDHHPDSGIYTGVLVARTAWLEGNADKLNMFMQEYQASIDYMTDASNIDTAAQYVVDLDILGNVNVAKASLPLSGLVLIKGEDIKSKLVPFYQILLETTPNLIGGEMPNDSIYMV